MGSRAGHRVATPLLLATDLVWTSWQREGKGRPCDNPCYKASDLHKQALPRLDLTNSLCAEESSRCQAKHERQGRQGAVTPRGKHGPCFPVAERVASGTARRYGSRLRGPEPVPMRPGHYGWCDGLVTRETDTEPDWIAGAGQRHPIVRARQPLGPRLESVRERAGSTA